MCDASGSVVTEIFAEGTVPTESCDIHYQGNVCLATGLPATDTCPYKVPGVITLPINDDGSSSISSLCPHTAEYYLNNPGAMITDSQAAQQAAQQAAAAAAAAQQPQPTAPAAPAPDTPLPPSETDPDIVVPEG